MNIRITTLLMCLLVHRTAFADQARGETTAVAVEEAIEIFDGDLDAFYTWLKDTQYEDPREVYRASRIPQVA